MTRRKISWRCSSRRRIVRPWRSASAPVGLHRVLDDRRGAAAGRPRLDARRELGPDEVRIRVERLNLDAASASASSTDEARRRRRRGPRAEVLASSRTGARCRTRSPAPAACSSAPSTRSARSRPLGPAPGDRVATLVSLTLTPLVITDGLARWDGRSEQVPGDGHAILFARSIAAVLPDDLDPQLALAVLDVCGAPGAHRPRGPRGYDGRRPVRRVIGGAGKSGSLSLAAARGAPAPRRTVGVVPHRGRGGRCCAPPGWPTTSSLADARDPVALATPVTAALGGPADVTVVCVDVPGCEHGAILATADGGTVIFFSMATSFRPPRWAPRGSPPT